jgi:hypothetical protein
MKAKKIMKNFSRIVLILMLSICANCFGMHEEFIPSKETCGAAVGKENIRDDIHSRLKCMIAGFKDVYFGPDIDLEDLTENEKNSMKAANIQKIIVEGNYLGDPSYGNILILYTEAGTKNAQLFEKYTALSIRKKDEMRKILDPILNEKNDLLNTIEGVMDRYIEKSAQLGNEDPEVIKLRAEMKRINAEIQRVKALITAKENEAPVNHYLTGILLGYDWKDIKDYYKSMNILNQFEQDKREAEQYIQENS